MIASALLGAFTVDEDDAAGNESNPLERWSAHREELSKAEELSARVENDSPGFFSYMDGPFPLTNEDGSYRGGLSGDNPCGPVPPWPDCYISETMRQSPNPLVNFSIGPVKAAGYFVVGDNHESLIGDKNGNGILEWVVIFLYIPWMEDGLDNDGDGCVDERYKPIWEGQTGCDNMYDGAVVYETGGQPMAGGDKGDLLVNLDLYSAEPSVKIFRARVTPPFHATTLRDSMTNLHIAGEFVSYQASESENSVNSNPELDSDMDDSYVGSVDARMFPARAPITNVCSSGLMSDDISPTFKRKDGHIITTYELVERFDGRDWNGDGDVEDNVIAYYTVDPNTGYCRIGVNTAVQGVSPRTSSGIIMPKYTSEQEDSRDWDRYGGKYQYVLLYHEINSTWHLRGRIFKSFTYYSLFITLYEFGFGWWALFKKAYSPGPPVLPFEIGVAYTKYVGMSFGLYNAYFSLISEEDGDRYTELPEHYIMVGMTAGIVGNRCVLIQGNERFMYYAGIRLINGGPDANGDGDMIDPFGVIFCADEWGGGFVVDPTSKYAKGLYVDPIPALWEGTVEIGVYPSVDGLVAVPSYSYDSCKLREVYYPHYFWRKIDQVYWMYLD